MTPFKLPDRVYDTIKWLLLIVVPAFATLYSIIAGELGIDHTESVLKILFAVAAFLGVILGVSSYGYAVSDDKYDGTIDPFLAQATTSNNALHIPEMEKRLKASKANPEVHKKEVLLKVQQPTFNEPPYHE